MSEVSQIEVISSMQTRTGHSVVPTHKMHRCLLLKLDTQPRSHLFVEVCIERGICTAPHPLQYGTLPPLGAMPHLVQE